MAKRISTGTRPAVARMLLVVLAGTSLFAATGCDEPDNDEGTVITSIELPTDLLLNLNCPEVGVNSETCILTDPENPYVTTTILEFDENNPDSPNKFELQDGIPLGPTGAKARFYLWGTALARRNSGENQYFTALALHELFTTNGDPIIRDQAIKAYRSVWDNFFGSVVFFTCCGEFFPTPREDTAFAVPLNELVLERLVRAAEFTSNEYPAGFAPLIPDDITGLDSGLIELETQEVISEWGFNYSCTGAGTEQDPRLCFVSVNQG